MVAMPSQHATEILSFSLVSRPFTNLSTPLTYRHRTSLNVRARGDFDVEGKAFYERVVLSAVVCEQSTYSTVDDRSRGVRSSSSQNCRKRGRGPTRRE